jgi:signal transduction histidine kinase
MTKQRLLAIIAHDLKTPLSSFTNTLEITKQLSHSFSKEQLIDWFDTIQNEFNTLLNLINNMLLWALHQQNQISYQPEWIVTEALIDENIQLIEHIAQKKNITISKEILLPPNHQILTDNNMMKFILRNIATNAIKYTSIGGKIHFKAEVIDNQKTKIQIIDNGIGIKAEDLPKLFNLSKGSHIKGTGLGLAMCKEFINIIQGEISIESQLHTGTTVKIMI